MMKHGLPALLLAALLMLGACRQATPDEQVRQAAETYYGYLVNGKCDAFVHGIAYCDSMTEEYRSQMVDLTAQYVAREQEQRGGLLSARALSDTILNGETALVFMEVLFGDSTREEVALPMVRCGDTWKMQ